MTPSHYVFIESRDLFESTDTGFVADAAAQLPQRGRPVTMARLLARSGRRAEARRILREIYEWFTEGLDTLDLRTARTLLDDLASGRTPRG